MTNRTLDNVKDGLCNLVRGAAFVALTGLTALTPGCAGADKSHVYVDGKVMDMQIVQPVNGVYPVKVFMGNQLRQQKEGSVALYLTIGDKTGKEGYVIEGTREEIYFMRESIKKDESIRLTIKGNSSKDNLNYSLKYNVDGNNSNEDLIYNKVLPTRDVKILKGN